VKYGPYGAAVSTGVLLILTFPNFDLSILCWIALVPLMLACAGEPRAGRRFLLGWIAGSVFFLGTCFWCYGVMHHYGNLSMVESTGVLLGMTSGLAVYFGLFTLAFPWTLSRPWLTLAGAGALWTACEFARGHVFIGFPWLFLGYAATDQMLLAQVASITGVYGLSFLVAGFNAGVFLVIRNSERRNWGMRLAAALMILAGVSLGGGLLKRERPTESAYLLQTGIPLDLEWTDQYREAFLRDMETKLIARYARNDSRGGLVLWPETPAPLYYQQDPELRAYVARLARSTDSHVLLNSVTYDEGTPRHPLNSTLGISPEGKLEGQYDKIELVPFGEHVPYSSFFFFAGKLTAEVGDFVPGQRYELLRGPRNSRVAAMICYEAGFPELVRELTSRGADVLVNQSNDGWFGDSPARRQHLLMARMRAIENDRWLLRATNDGLSAVIDPQGRVESFPSGERAVFLARYALKSSQTIYTRLGDWFAYLCMAMSAAVVVIYRGRK
jgi:apolipoprotein N-acyltransferase